MNNKIAQEPSEVLSENAFNINNLSETYKSLITTPELICQIFDMLPAPIEIFAPDGTSIYINRACMEMCGITEASLITGKYNLRTDPVCLEICGQEFIDRVFMGETCSFPDFPFPIQDLVDRGVILEKPWEAATMDLLMLPVWDKDKFVCVICFFTVKNMYRGRADIVKAQEYIRRYWLEEFDLDKIAQVANLSRRHFQRIFKEVTGIAPIDYYQNIKIEKLQEKLLDNSLSIEQSFSACGVDYRGKYSHYFKEKVGMTPSKYRKENLKTK